MENLFSTEVILAVLSAIAGGVAWLVKHYIAKKDEEQKRIFEERDRDKQEIKQNIKDLQSDVKEVKKHLRNVSAMVLKCENPECPTKKALADYWERQDRDNLI